MAEANGSAGGAETNGAADMGTIEPDRDELAEPPRYRFALSHRQFLGTVGAGVVVLVVVRNGLSLEEQPAESAPPAQPRYARSSSAMSILTIFSNASLTRFERAGSASRISSSRAAGTICQRSPYRSMSQLCVL